MLVMTHTTSPYGQASEAESRILTEIIEMSGDGMSAGQIAYTLNQRGVPARGSRWHATTIYRILRRVGDTGG